MANLNDTQFISLPKAEDHYSQTMDPEEVLSKVYEALKEKGYDPET